MQAPKQVHLPVASSSQSQPKHQTLENNSQDWLKTGLKGFNPQAPVVPALVGSRGREGGWVSCRLALAIIRPRLLKWTLNGLWGQQPPLGSMSVTPNKRVACFTGTAEEPTGFFIETPNRQISKSKCGVLAEQLVCLPQSQSLHVIELTSSTRSSSAQLDINAWELSVQHRTLDELYENLKQREL